VRIVIKVVGVLTLLGSQSVFAACSGSGTSFTCTAGSTIANVQSAISAASDGATISFAAGSYSWTSGGIELSPTKGVTLLGAGASSTIVTVGGNSFIAMNGTLSGNNTKNYRISGFTFQNGSNLGIWLYGPGTLNNLRIDHNTFSNWAVGGIPIFLGETGSAAKFFGVIDHNTLKGPNNFMMLKVLGTGNPNLWSSSVRGTSNNLFVEDNTLNFDSASDLGSGCLDAWNSAAVVFRYNTTNNCLLTAHGTTHGGGTVNFEAYGNTLQRVGGDATWNDGTRLIHHQGSGEITIFGNTFVHSGTISGSAISITHYRSADPGTAGYSTSLGRCDGSSSRDGNLTPQSTYYGYPCWMQPGRAPNGGSPGYGKLSPIYAWQNVDNSNGGRVPAAIDDPWGGTPNPTTHIVANRDYYNAVSASAQTSSTSPFNGTSGMGFGTLANRPTSCTTSSLESGGGVAYWATDQGQWNTNTSGADGQLYKCVATNTWAVDYVPYQYPHPLQGSASVPPSPPAAPSGLQATVR
jgi:hypothetical protein